jgi:hypothetical protein
MQKALDVTSPEALKKAAPHAKIHGDPNFWICIAKASSDKQQWMHSTKVALVRGYGLLVQTSTELRDPQGIQPTSSQALSLVPGAYLEGYTGKDGPVYEIRSCTDGDHSPGSFFLDGVRQLTPSDRGGPRGGQSL